MPAEPAIGASGVLDALDKPLRKGMLHSDWVQSWKGEGGAQAWLIELYWELHYAGEQADKLGLFTTQPCEKADSQARACGSYAPYP